MGAPDCPVCEAMGYRSCDRCGSPFRPGDGGGVDGFGFELCAGCGGPAGGVRA